MMTKESIAEVVFSAIDEHNATYPENALCKSPDVVLFGTEASLSSLQFVSLILDVEAKIEERCGTRIVLASDKAFSAKSSPFRTTRSLIAFVAETARGDAHVE